MHESFKQLFEMAVDRIVTAESEVARLQALVTKYESGCRECGYLSCCCASRSDYYKTIPGDEVVLHSRP